MTAPPDLELSFGRLRALADVLALAAKTRAPLRPFMIELFRAQVEFNHRLVDVLEDAVWIFRRADRATLIEGRLGPLARAAPDVVKARGGVQGLLIVWAKRVGLAGLEAALGHATRSMGQTNQAVVEALGSGRPFPPGIGERRSKWLGLDPWFEAQARFFQAAGRLTHELDTELADASAAFFRLGPAEEAASKTRWPRSAARIAIQLLSSPGRVDPGSEAVLRVPAGEALAPDALETVSELFASRPEVQLVYGDTLFEESGLVSLKPGWSPEYLLSSSYIGGCFAMRTPLASKVGLEAGGEGLRMLLEARLTEGQVVRVPWALSTRRGPAPNELDVKIVQAHLGASATVVQQGEERIVRPHAERHPAGHDRRPLQGSTGAAARAVGVASALRARAPVRADAGLEPIGPARDVRIPRAAARSTDRLVRVGPAVQLVGDQQRRGQAGQR